MPLLTLALTALLATNSAAAAPAATKPDVPAPALAHAWLELGQSLRNSASPRDWALASQIFVESGDEAASAAKWRARGALLRKAAEAAPKDAYVQWLWANAMPAMVGCDAHAPCPERAAALAKLEPDNGAAWVPIINAAMAANNMHDADAALAHAVAATRYDERWSTSWKAWRDVYRRYPLPATHDQSDPFAADAEMSADGMAFSMAGATGVPAYAPLVRGCTRARYPQATAAHFEDCGKLGRIMLKQGITMLAQSIGAGILQVSATANADDRAAARSVEWRQHQYATHALPFDQPSEIRAYVADLERTGNEVEAQQLQLRRAGLSLTPPADWKPTRFGLLDASSKP
ncbi:MAG: hypothetical protein ABI365_05300 [Lysobacteraceae bacterium]